MNYQFSDAEASWLLDLVLAKLCAVAARMADVTSIETHRMDLLLWARVAAELHQPSPAMSPAAPPVREDSETSYMRRLAADNGLDYDKEYGSMDPRAFAPRCTHGRLFTHPCVECEGRCPHGLEQTLPCKACGRGVVVVVGDAPLDLDAILASDGGELRRVYDRPENPEHHPV